MHLQSALINHACLFRRGDICKHTWMNKTSTAHLVLWGLVGLAHFNEGWKPSCSSLYCHLWFFPQHTERFLLLPNVCHAAWPRTAVHWRSAGEMHPGIITTSFPGHPTPVWTSGDGTTIYTSIYIVNQYQGHRFINQQSSFTRFLTIMYTHITANFSCAGRLRVCTVVEHVPITHDRCYAIC